MVDDLDLITLDAAVQDLASDIGEPLLRRNVKDIERTGVRWINPFD